jgi:hypothetical protein
LFGQAPGTTGPILETWRNCANVKGGWRGVQESGEIVFICEHDRVARIPKKNRIIRTDRYGQVVGVMLLERAKGCRT